MKKIAYRGYTIRVEDWARYVTQDGEGTIRQHECEPTFGPPLYMWSAGKGRCEVVGPPSKRYALRGAAAESLSRVA
jgi:hypothetical protein